MRSAPINTANIGQKIAEARLRAKPTRAELADRAATLHYGKPHQWIPPIIGITQRELGHRMGFSGANAGTAISRLESGAQEPRLGTLIRLAEALGVKRESLLPV